MGHVVDIFKVVPLLISQRIDDVLDEKKYRFTFKHYVDRNNIEERRLQNPLDAYTVVNKIKTDLYQLNTDEWMEILLWLKETASEAHKHDFEFKVPEVSAHIAQYGLVYVDRINDRDHRFSFTLGDFLADHYNGNDADFDYLQESTCYLSAEEFRNFIAYGLHLSAKMLIKENNFIYRSKEYLISILGSIPIDEKLKPGVEESLKYIMEDKEISADASNNLIDNVKYGRYYCNIQGFDYFLNQFEELWKLYKDNQLAVVII